MQAAEEEIAADMEWARSRKLVKERRALIEDGNDPWNDPLSGARAALNASERGRLVEYCRRFARYAHGGDITAFDLGMNPDERPLRSKQGVLHTLIKGMGVTFVCRGPAASEHDRWLVGSELLAAQGLPTTAEHVAAYGGVQCQFSPGRVAPPTRSHATPWQQAGNGMHLNHIGGVSAAILFSTFMLGATKQGDIKSSP